MIRIVPTKCKGRLISDSVHRLVKNNLLSLESEIPESQLIKEAGKRDLNEEFQILEQLTYLKTHEERFNKDPSVQHLNRYSDILPCKP